MGLFSFIQAQQSGLNVSKPATTGGQNTKTGGGAIIGGAAQQIAGGGDTSKKTQEPSGGKKQQPAQKQPETPAPPAYTPPDTDIVTWSGNGGISFFVKPTKVQGVSQFNIEASANTEEKDEDDEKLTKRKSNGAITITLKAYLNAFLGANVQDMAQKAIEAARKGDTGYLYSYGKKLFPSQFIMSAAKASNILTAGNGKWVSCELDLTLKQSTKAGDGQMTTGSEPQGSGKKTKTENERDRIKGAAEQNNDAKKQSQKILSDSKRPTDTAGDKAPQLFAGEGLSFD